MFILTLMFAFSEMIQEPPPSHQNSVEVLDHYIQSGIKAMNNNNYPQALKWIDRALIRQSSNAELYRLKAQILEMMGEYKEAIKAWNACSKVTKDKNLKQEAALHIKRLKI